MQYQKTYDCVAEVRKIRDELGPKHWDDDELFKKYLADGVEHFHRDQKRLREERLKRENEQQNESTQKQQQEESHVWFLKKHKTYDCVAEVRKIRDEMSLKYWDNPALFYKDVKDDAAQFRLETKRLREERQQHEGKQPEE